LNDAIDFSGYFAQINIIAAIVVILAVLLLAGGLLNKSSLTVISGLLIFVLFVFLMFSHSSSFFDGSESDSLKNILEKIIPASIGFYFMARGNKG
jgi:ATP/ADP translocase